MSYDAVVIGAGHNGLAAAVRLAEKGWSVAVVEGKETAGGAVKTQELTLPGFRHDLCAMNLSMFAGSGFFAAHKQALLDQGLGFMPAQNCFASVFRDGTYLGVSTSLDKTTAGIAALSPADAQAWRDLVAALWSRCAAYFRAARLPDALDRGCKGRLERLAPARDRVVVRDAASLPGEPAGLSSTRVSRTPRSRQ